MSVKDTTVRLRTVDGTWETLGSDRRTGVWPENIRLEADEWGPSKASFELRRDPGVQWPDLLAFTPVEIEVAGVTVWSGRTVQTPGRAGSQMVLDVECQGWQFHLDDDVYERAYVHNRLGDWRDARTYLGENLAQYTAAGVVGADRGAITLGWPNGAVLALGARVGVTIDLGPYSRAKSISVDALGITGAANSGASLTVTGHNDERAGQSLTGGYGEAPITYTLATLGTNASANDGDFTTGRRYLTISLSVPAGVTLNGDVTVQIKAIRIFAETTYRSGHASVLRASTVISDAVDKATMLLSSDRTGIVATTFDIETFAPGEPRTPREVIEAVNAFHDWMTKVDVDKRMIFQARPARPAIELGEWSAKETEDQSANSGAEIYNRVLVVGTSEADQPVVVERTQGQQSGALTAITSPAPDNPTFATNAASWTNVTRYTTASDSAPASGQLTGDATETFTGTFLRGVTYVLQLKTSIISALLTVTRGTPDVLTFGDQASGDVAKVVLALPTGGWDAQTIAWTPTADRTGVTLTFALGTTITNSRLIDSLALFTVVSTLVDRQRFRRTKILQIQSPLGSDGVAAARLGDTWLAGHKTTPFKGTDKLTGDAARHILTGQTVPLEQLLARTGELVRYSDQSDPDTGAQGRDGRLASVVYTPADDTAEITVDNTRKGFEALLARLAVVTGG